MNVAVTRNSTDSKVKKSTSAIAKPPIALKNTNSYANRSDLSIHSPTSNNEENSYSHLTLTAKSKSSIKGLNITAKTAAKPATTEK